MLVDLKSQVITNKIAIVNKKSPIFFSFQCLVPADTSSVFWRCGRSQIFNRTASRRQLSKSNK